MESYLIEFRNLRVKELRQAANGFFTRTDRSWRRSRGCGGVAVVWHCLLASLGGEADTASK
jgi:hypothetical protein